MESTRTPLYAHFNNQISEEGIPKPTNATMKGVRVVALTNIDIVVLCLLGILIFAGVFGNLHVIYLFGFQRRNSRSRYRQLVVVLSVVDLFCSVLVPSLFIYGTVTKYSRWDFGEFGCKIIPAVLSMNVTVSQGILVLISYVRYRSIVSPLRETISRGTLVLSILLTFLLSLALASPYIYSLELVRDPRFNVNTCMPANNKYEYVFAYSMNNFIRDIIATIILTTINHQMAQAIKSDGALQESQSSMKLHAARSKARKILKLLVVAFSICVIPVDIFQVVVYTLYLVQVRDLELFKIILIINTFLNILQASNSVTNVILHTGTCKSFFTRCFQSSSDGKETSQDRERITLKEFSKQSRTIMD